MVTTSSSTVTTLEQELSEELAARRHEIIARAAQRLRQPEPVGRCCAHQLELQMEYYRTQEALDAIDEHASIPQLQRIVQPKPHLIDEVEGLNFYGWSALKRRLYHLGWTNYAHLWEVATAKKDHGVIDALGEYDY